ncbi:MAG: hypothetical protein LBB80_01370 [Treponema sp.]|jgi:hypothetical protein|nr:hypothetical protein [Treponema sp.]
MKKYKWLVAGILVLILAGMIMLIVSAKSIGNVCAEDGSCCVDPAACTCE